MKEKKGLSINIFWLIVLFHLDPGGFKHTYLTPIADTLFSFASLFVAVLIFNFHYKNAKFNIFQLKFVKSYIILMLFWYLYYFTVYYGYNNDEFPGIMKAVIRNAGIFFKSIIVIPIVYFSMFSLNSFLRILVWTTIIIGFMFIVSVFTGVELVETWNANRNVGGLKRNFMYGYGLINFMIPITLSIIFLKFKLNKKILLAALIAVAIIFITIWRRDMVGLIEYVVIIAFLVGYIEKKGFFKSMTKYVNFRSILLFSLLIFFLSILVPKSLDAFNKVAIGTMGTLGLIENTKSVNNADDIRMSLSGKVGIITAIKDNFYTGTGFDPAWGTGDGGDKQWEGSDYIFLAAFAMYGLIGLLIFLPFYIIYLKIVINLLKLLRNNKKRIYKHIEYIGIPVVIGISASSEIIKNILEYPNWFYPIGAISNNSKYFIFFALLLGSYYNIKIQLNSKKITNG